MDLGPGRAPQVHALCEYVVVVLVARAPVITEARNSFLPCPDRGANRVTPLVQFGRVEQGGDFHEAVPPICLDLCFGYLGLHAALSSLLSCHRNRPLSWQRSLGPLR